VNNGLRAAALIALVSAAAGCGAAPADAAGGTAVHRLRYASPNAPSHPFSRADQLWIDHVHAASAGRIAIEPSWAGALLSAEHSMLELRHGVADIAAITPIYARGGAQLLRAQTGFYRGARSMRAQLAVYKCLSREFPAFERELIGLRVLAVQGGNLPGVLTRGTPVRTLADLASLRLRAPAELTDVLRELGADPVSMPMGEVYSALSKGVIDGVVAPAEALRSMHLAEVGRYFTSLQMPRGAYPARAISEAAWRRLPTDLRQLLIASSALWEDAIEQQLQLAAERGAQFGRERDLTWIAIAPAEQRRFDAIYNRGALRGARELSRFGIDGVPIFERAQSLIGSMAGGEPATCAAPE
jgi:TRAP-type C4-dicarboxylate transport system substrate-binding protein